MNSLDLLTPQNLYYELCSNGKYKNRPNRTFYSVEDINKRIERVIELSRNKVDNKCKYCIEYGHECTVQELHDKIKYSYSPNPPNPHQIFLYHFLPSILSLFPIQLNVKS